jgi:hypothetical protein
MKKLVVIIAVLTLSLAVAGSALALEEKPYGAAGCGLGGMLIGNEPGPIQLVATFLNSLCGNQTFGITSGTLGCATPRGKHAKNDALNQFVVANMDNLAKDIAKGRGETLETFAELMQVPAESRVAFYQKLQANFTTIFPSENVVLADVVDNIMTVASN